MLETPRGTRKGEPPRKNSKTTSKNAPTGLNRPTTRSTLPPDDVLRIVVLGPQGCGKSSLINAAHGKPLHEISDGYSLSTTKFHSMDELHSGKRRFLFIDSPGFDNPIIDDSEIFDNFVEYLHCAKPPLKLSGVIYIHPEGSSLGSGGLKRNLDMLKILLGREGLKRITILLVPRSLGEYDHEKLTGPLFHPKSPFTDLCASGARIIVSRLETQPIREMLLQYSELGSQLVESRRERPIGQIRAMKRYIGGYLHKETGPGDSRTTNHSSRNEQDLKIEKRDSNELQRLKSEVDQSNSRADDLNTQLQQTRAEYASLRSQLQIHENTEQSQIVQDLIDLNRQIDDFGHSFSRHLIDLYADSSRTSRHAFCLTEVEKLFAPTKGVASLVQSSAGVGMPLDDFFDLAARSLLCEQLYKRVFLPFHPGMVVSDPRNVYTSQLYTRIRLQEPQPSAGRWRIYAFDAISRMIGSSEMTRLKSQLLPNILENSLTPFLKHFFGADKGVQLKSQHIESLGEITRHAWDWNMLLKGKIILLGDFQPIAYQYGADFDGQTMAEFEPEPGNPSPDRILSTIGMGLASSRTLGGGETPERTILQRARVVSEQRFPRT